MKSLKKVSAAILSIMLMMNAASCGNDKEREKDAFAEQSTTLAAIQTTISDTTTKPKEATTLKNTATTTNQATSTTTATTTTSQTLTSVSTAPTSPPSVVTTTSVADSSLSFTTSGILRNNAEFESLMNDLNNIMYPYRNTVSFTYENIENGVYISYNGNKRYNSCSTIKAPYCKALIASSPDLSQEIVMTSSTINGYSGRIDGKPIGTAFSLEYLIYRTIVFSDNTAYNMLYKEFGYSAFNDLTTSIGLTTKLGDGFNYRKVSSNEMRTYFMDIYNFCETDSGAYLRELLTNCDYNVQIGYALPQYEVAQKYGCQTSTCDLHDCAIVYAESPFILTIMSDLNPDDVQSLAIFRQLAQILDQINTQQTEPEMTTTTTTKATTTTTTTTTTKTSTTTKKNTTTTKKTTTVPKATTNATTITSAPVTTITTVPTTAQTQPDSRYESAQVQTTTTSTAKPD